MHLVMHLAMHLVEELLEQLVKVSEKVLGNSDCLRSLRSRTDRWGSPHCCNSTKVYAARESVLELATYPVQLLA